MNVAIREAESGGKFVLKVVYATSLGFHVVDDSGSQDIFIPTAYGSDSIRPHCIMTFPKSDEPAFLLCYNSEGAYVTDEGKFFRDAFLQWGEAPITSVGKWHSYLHKPVSEYTHFFQPNSQIKVIIGDNFADIALEIE